MSIHIQASLRRRLARLGIAIGLFALSLSACVGPDLEPPAPSASVDAREAAPNVASDAGAHASSPQLGPNASTHLAAAGSGGDRAQTGTSTPNPMAAPERPAAETDADADAGTPGH